MLRGLNNNKQFPKNLKIISVNKTSLEKNKSREKCYKYAKERLANETIFHTCVCARPSKLNWEYD